MSQVPRVLVAQTDAATRAQLEAHLQHAGIDCAVATDPSTILTLVTEKYFDVIVLDVTPSGVTIQDLCLAIRRTPLNRYAAFVVCDARAAAAAAAGDLDLYVPRSRAPADVAHEIRAAIAGRAPRSDDGWLPPVAVRDLRIDPARQRLHVRGRQVPVTKLECQFLYLLASHPGLVFSRRRLLARLWPPDTYVTPRSVDALVGRLRRKIEQDPASPRILLTAWGEGYSIGES